MGHTAPGPVLSTPHHRKEWRLRDIRGEWIVLRWFDLAEGEELWKGPFSVSVLLNQWFSDSACRPVLRDLCWELWGGPAYRPDHLRRNRDLQALLIEEFHCGRLLLIGPKTPPPRGITGIRAGSGRDSNLAAILAASRAKQAAIKQRDDAARRASKQKTWVAIRLQDEKGQPIPDERYRVVLPDGSVQEGKLNAKGEAYFYEINPGQCQISFPDVHRSEWKSA